MTALILSCQMVLGTFFLSILGIRRARRPTAPADAAGGAFAPISAAPQAAVQRD